ncbi:MAG: alpha/beta hydrolase [Pirellulaceae bacterium]
MRSLARTGIAVAVCLMGSGRDLCWAQATPAAAVRPVDALAARLEPTRTLVYKTMGDRELRLHLFEPDGHRPEDRRPVLIAIHGGGWTGGEPRRFYPFAAHFQRLGWVGVSVEYRLLNRPPGTTVFDCVCDGRSAVRYVRSHAQELGIDPDRIAVCGGSAGGHVAAGTALFPEVNDPQDDSAISPIPNALILYYPVIDTSGDGYGQAKIGERWRELSPVHRVRGGLPRTIVFHGTGDRTTPFRGAQAFADGMRAAGNTCELVIHEGGVHGYFLYDLHLFAETMKRTEQFLAEAGVGR